MPIVVRGSMVPPAENNTAEKTVPFISRTAEPIAAMPVWVAFQWNVMGHGPIGPNESRKIAISALLEQLEALPVETILEYKYQIALEDRKKEYEQAQNALAGKRQDYETLRSEIAKALRGESLFQLTLLHSVLEETEQAVQEKTERLFELEAKLQNAEQLRREIRIKQLKYCGLNQIFTSGTMEEKKMLLSILVRRVEVRQGYELNIQLTPGFEQFLDGLIEMR